MYGRRLKAYKRTSADAVVSVADPHRITQMMFDGIINQIAQTKGAIERRDFKEKANHISRATGLVNALQMSLDPTQDAQLASVLSALYDYMKQLLSQASISMETDPLDEVVRLITPIRDAWAKIPDDVKHEINAQILAKRSIRDAAERQQREEEGARREAALAEAEAAETAEAAAGTAAENGQTSN